MKKFTNTILEQAEELKATINKYNDYESRLYETFIPKGEDQK